MVKTRRSGENGDPEDEAYIPNDVASVSEDKHASDSSQQKEVRRSARYRVTRKLWPVNQLSRRKRRNRMPRIMYPESDTDPDKYSRRRRPVRVFFAGDTPDVGHRSRRKRTPRKNYVEDTSEDKPIQQNVRRSGRQRKLLHHSFNESWITNELKVRGYPGLYGLQGSSSSDESIWDEPSQPPVDKKDTRTITDAPTTSSRVRRTSARFSKKMFGASESESDQEANQTVIENKKRPEKKEEKTETELEKKEEDNDKMEVEIETKQEKIETEIAPDSESNQGATRSMRPRRTRKAPIKKNRETGSENGSTDSESEDNLGLNRQPRRSNRTAKPNPAYVQISTRPQAKTYTIRKKQYSLRERKSPKILRRKTIRSQSSTSSSSSSSSDTEEDLNVSVKNKTKGRQKSKAMGENSERALREIQPVQIDSSVTFASVGGLEEHIRCLREMVLFPIMYPDVFQKFRTRPAKGVLFHGPPGTGKTLLARALATESSMIGGRKVAFFMRKGADCLKKWVGESERHLKLLFQQANKMKPSIIFFDEIDALAPVRSVRQEQVHTSVVGTLLAEMDGLCDRGEVVVIGATNRLDAVDPALRRAGRFDRELHFPPPHTAARKDILHIYTKAWDPKPKEAMLDRIAEITNGYGGSDIKALCSEAVLRALRRVYPQVYESEHVLLIDAKKVEVQESDMLDAMRALVAAGERTSPLPSKPLPHYTVPLLVGQLEAAEKLLKKVFSRPEETRLGEHSVGSGNVLLICGVCSETHIAPALLASLEKCTVKELSMAVLHSALAFSTEQALITVFSECRRADRGCVLFVRDIVSLWTFLGPTGVTLFNQLWRSRSSGNNTLLLATTEACYEDIPTELQDLFPAYKDCIYTMRDPTSVEVINFLKPAIVEAPLKHPTIEKNEPPPPLPKAPPPPPPKESHEERSKRKRLEDYKLRELRIFLRDICRKLAANRRFYKFTKPVDLEEVTDYLDIVKQPMDLETMMTKVDMHRYNCAKEFLEDIDLICANALEYNPDRTSSDKQIRHEACSLRDHAHALIEVEMDSDFEAECQKISTTRREEGRKNDDLPSFIFTASHVAEGLVSNEEVRKVPSNTEKAPGTTQAIKRKRRRMNAWSKGLVVKKPKTVHKIVNKEEQNSLNITDEESKENKPIVTSTPLPNGDGHYTGSSNDDTMSDADQSRVNPDESEVIFRVLESPSKTSEKPTSQRTSPKKRNSGHESSSTEAEKLIINKTDLENILYKNAKTLRSIGLPALLDLYGQTINSVEKYRNNFDRSKLPSEILAIVNRYIHELARK